jgi:YD repeat-containing protein
MKAVNELIREGALQSSPRRCSIASSRQNGMRCNARHGAFCRGRLSVPPTISPPPNHAGQLTRERTTGGPAQVTATYTYDPVGNRDNETVNGSVYGYKYDAPNQLEDRTGPDHTSYAYDACGNRTQKNAASIVTYYGWDARNRPKYVEPVAGRVTMGYDPLDRRVRKDAPGGTTNFVWDHERLLREEDGGSSLIREYTWTDSGYGDLLSAYDGASRYYEFGPPGSAEALLDDSVSVTDRYAYQAFGLASHTTGANAQPHTFVGQKGYQADSELDL